MTKLNKEQTEEIARCAADFNYFCNKYVKIHVPNISTSIPFELYPYQVRLYEHIEDNRFTIFSKFRQGGFTTELATYGLWKCLFRLDQKILWLSPSERDARDVCDRLVKRMIDGLPDWMKGNIMKMANSNQKSFPETDSVMHFQTPEKARGKSASLLIVDEASFIKNMKQHWTPLWSSLGTSGRAIVFSTVDYDNDWFWQTKEDAALKLNTFAIYDCKYSERPEFCDSAWQQDAKSNIGQSGWDCEYEQKPKNSDIDIPVPKVTQKQWRSIWDEWESSSV